MNKKVENFLRQQIKDGLMLCNEKQQDLFVRMYAKPPYDSNTVVFDIVDKMPSNKLEWALTQVDRTLEKNNDGLR